VLSNVNSMSPESQEQTTDPDVGASDAHPDLQIRNVSADAAAPLKTARHGYRDASGRFSPIPPLGRFSVGPLAAGAPYGPTHAIRLLNGHLVLGAAPSTAGSPSP